MGFGDWVFFNYNAIVYVSSQGRIVYDSQHKTNEQPVRKGFFPTAENQIIFEYPQFSRGYLKQFISHTIIGRKGRDVVFGILFEVINKKQIQNITILGIHFNFNVKYIIYKGSMRQGVRCCLPIQSVPFTTNVVSSNPSQGRGVQYYVIKFVSDLGRVGGVSPSSLPQ